jgi:hypothetical protein
MQQTKWERRHQRMQEKHWNYSTSGAERKRAQTDRQTQGINMALTNFLPVSKRAMGRCDQPREKASGRRTIITTSKDI